ncbi:MAG: Fe-S cluster assembly protein SufD [Synechococcus sp.]|nr:Fe-S cluster assembly protein SufD [Synechococcus sp.]
MPVLTLPAAAAWLGDLAGEPLPGRRQEAWRFTDLAPLQAIAAELWSGPDPFSQLALPGGISRIAAAEAQLLLDQGLQSTGSSAAWPVRLNRGASPPLLALRVSGSVEPLQLTIDAAAGQGLLALQLLLVLEEGSSLELLLHHHSQAANATSLLTVAQLGRGARLNLGVLAPGDARASLLSHLAISQAPGSSLALTTAIGGWALSRLEPRIVQSEGAAHTRLRSLQLVAGKELADTHSQVHFAGPEGQLDQLHKVVADGAGRSVFNGAVRVPRQAQQTNAAQLSRSLLLSDRARVDSKPELEIVADDVTCAHGATVSRLQQNELFYLQSRGIAADQASRLLLRGYCDEVLRELPAAAASAQPLQLLLRERP